MAISVKYTLLCLQKGRYFWYYDRKTCRKESKYKNMSLVALRSKIYLQIIIFICLFRNVIIIVGLIIQLVKLTSQPGNTYYADDRCRRH